MITEGWRASGRFADWPAVLAEAKAAADTVSVGHAGNGTTNHIAILRLQVNERVSFNIIPYKGSGPGLTDLMGGQIDCYVDQLSKLMDIRVVTNNLNQISVFTNSGVELVGAKASQLAFNAQGTVNATTLWDADPAKSNLGTLTLVSPGGM